MPTVFNDRIAFLHVPKTGGTWVYRALIEARVPLRDPVVEDPDPHYAQKGHVTLEELGPAGRELFTIAFVRHPLDWWLSVWAHRMREGWIFPDHEIDSRASSEDFDTFVKMVIENLPGFAGTLFERFTGPPSAPVSFVGRYERLVDDLCDALRLAGQPFDEARLRAFPPYNVGDYESHPARYRRDLARRLARAEHAAIARFYPERLSPLNRLRPARPRNAEHARRVPL
jgi:hypothetical protein